MTEADWLTCNAPVPLIQFIRKMDSPEHRRLLANKRSPLVVSERKIRLIACACARMVWDHLEDDAPCYSCLNGINLDSFNDPGLRQLGPPLGTGTNCSICKGSGRLNRSRHAVEVAEHIADGIMPSIDTVWAQTQSYITWHNDSFEHELAYKCVYSIKAITRDSGLPRWFSVSTKYAKQQAQTIREIVGNPFNQVTLCGLQREVLNGSYVHFKYANGPRKQLAP